MEKEVSEGERVFLCHELKYYGKEIGEMAAVFSNFCASGGTDLLEFGFNTLDRCRAILEEAYAKAAFDD